MMQLLMGQWMTCDKLSSGARLPLYSEQYYTWWFTNSMICCHIVSQTIQYTVAIISCHIVTQWLLFSLKRESFDAQAMHNAQLHIGLLHNAHYTIAHWINTQCTLHIGGGVVLGGKCFIGLSCDTHCTVLSGHRCIVLLWLYALYSVYHCVVISV